MTSRQHRQSQSNMIYRPKWDGNTIQKEGPDPEIAKMIYKRMPAHSKKISTVHNKFGVMIKPIEDWDLLTAWAHGAPFPAGQDTPLKSYGNLSPTKPSQSHTPITGVST